MSTINSPPSSIDSYNSGFRGRLRTPDLKLLAVLSSGAAHNLYELTKAGLQALYPRFAPRELHLIHDYSSGHWSSVIKAMDEFFLPLPEKLILLPDKSGTATIRKASC